MRTKDTNNRSSNHQTSNVSIGWDVTNSLLNLVEGVFITSVKDSQEEPEIAEDSKRSGYLSESV